MKHSHSLAAFTALALTVFFAIGGSAQQTVPARGTAPPAGAGGRGRGAPETDTLGAGPWDLPAGRGRVHVSVVTKGVDHPWGITFLPDGGMASSTALSRISQTR